MADDLTKHLSDESYIIHHMSRIPQPRLSAFDEFIAFLSTPFKRLGISGWTKTSCSAGGVGQIKQIGQSTDGFITIDVWVTRIAISCNHGTTIGTTTSVNNNRYIRLEVEPGTDAHSYFRRTPFAEGQTIFFQGPILIDRDGDGFYEVHPGRASGMQPSLLRLSLGPKRSIPVRVSAVSATTGARWFRQNVLPDALGPCVPAPAPPCASGWKDESVGPGLIGGLPFRQEQHSALGRQSHPPHANSGLQQRRS